jgi:hypothetical protein
MSLDDCRVKCLAAIAVLLCASQIAAAQDMSSRRVKKNGAAHDAATAARPIVVPELLSPPQEAYAGLPEPAAAEVPPEPSACQVQLAEIAAFQALPKLAGPGECGAADPVRLEAVVLADKSRVAVAPPATLRCTMAQTLAQWLREDVAPDVAKLGATLRGMENFDSYDCRGRNRVVAAKLSEHGRGNAIDIRGFKLSNGKVVGLTDVDAAKDFRTDLRTSACTRFNTVLGPGSDGYHESHVHLDLAERRGGYKMCQWDVLDAAEVAARAAAKAAAAAARAGAAAKIAGDIPLPRPRPVVNAAKEPGRRSR